MKANMGSVDKVMRLIVAIVIAALYMMNVISGAVAIGLLVIAGIFILTSLVGFCPLYLPFGINTLGKGDKK
jgi:hypothetical protein